MTKTDACGCPLIAIQVDTYVKLEHVHAWLQRVDDGMMAKAILPADFAQATLEDCVRILQGILKECYGVTSCGREV